MTAEPIPEALAAILEANGYVNVRRLPTGEIAGVQQFIFTTGIVVGLTEAGWRTRFCYERSLEAIRALDAWDGEGFPPGYWIKEKGEREVQGPGGSRWYRPQRGSLEDSMREAVPIKDFDALVAHLQKEHDRYPVATGLPRPSHENVEVRDYEIFDERIGWITYIVTIENNGWGFTNGPLEKKVPA